MTRRALTYAYRVVLPRMKSERYARTGYSTPPQNRMIERNFEFMYQVVREETPTDRDVSMMDVRRMMDDEMATGGEVQRIVREHVAESCMALVEVVRGLPDPVHDVLVLVSSGFTPRQAAKMLPHRAAFSVADDYRRGLDMVWCAAGEHVRNIV